MVADEGRDGKKETGQKCKTYSKPKFWIDVGTLFVLAVTMVGVFCTGAHILNPRKPF